MKNIAILVLAAGTSSRMKTPKQLVKIGTNFLLETVLSKAKSINHHSVYCVLGANATLIRKEISCPDIHFIYNSNFNEGLSASIVAGITEFELKNKKFDAVLILLGDQPAIAKEYLNAMVDLFSKDKSKIIASNYGEKLGVPAIFPKSYFSTLKKMLGDFGAKAILNENKDVIALNEQTNFIDIDTEKDLEDFKKSILK
ncbi:nucleotidyltransferase family protein [Polaribacter sp. ALD11]|uniref:nucleotidyltransferase family protein n=1 Tax=Polaribacter sp. ALD11 TaxID=2058137 RepID=UPI000C3072B2|nr:nucleotidyltransferase family protein [Polaribacter sp. ALD11]AUC85333.1 nucleotidyltransferase family protein [Polaribacter sp. ALD11]